MKGKLKLYFPFTVRNRDDSGNELPEDVVEILINISNGELDGHFSRMADDTLSNYAKGAASGRIPFLIDHNSNDIRSQIGMLTEGAFDEKEKTVQAVARMLRDTDDTPDNMKVNEFIRRIEAGLYRGVSVSFADADEICDICSKDVWNVTGSDGCRHIPGRTYDGEKATYEIRNARLREVSLVSAPSNKEAGVINTRSDDWTEELKKAKVEGDTGNDGKTDLEREGMKWREQLIESALKEGVRAEDGFDKVSWQKRLEDMNSDSIIAMTKTWKESGDAKWGSGGRKTDDGKQTPPTGETLVLPDYLFQ